MTAWGKRIHLRTVVTFAVIATVLIWVNVLIREAEVLRLFQDSVLYGYGWPAFSVEGFPRPVPGRGMGIYFIEKWNLYGCAINLGTAMLILVPATTFAEFSARLSARREQSA